MGETHEESRLAGWSGQAHRWTTVAVAGHLVVALAHGVPHEVAPVPLATWQTAFVVLVVIAGPPVGLWFAWRGYSRLGGGLLATTGAASFLFGTYYHFFSDTADNVARVDGAWGSPFLVTAVLLSVAALAVTVAGVVRWRAAA